MKKRLNTDPISNELRGASAFFPRLPKRDQSTGVPPGSPAVLPAAPDVQTPRHLDAQVPRHPDTQASRHPGAQASRPLDTAFDLNATPDVRQTLRLTDGEFRRLGILQARLSEALDVTRVEKNDILRAALHRLLEEFSELAMEGDLVTRLRQKYR